MSTQNIKPSTRPLLQFVSPNPNTRGTIVHLQETQALDLMGYKTQLTQWEDNEISALAITTHTEVLALADVIQQTKKHLSCPFLRIAPVSNAQDLRHTRALDFDAQLFSTQDIPQEVLRDLHKEAQAMNLQLIFAVHTEADWQRVHTLKPRFIFVENHQEFLQKIPKAETWLIGRESFAKPELLKCILRNE